MHELESLNKFDRRLLEFITVAYLVDLVMADSLNICRKKREIAELRSAEFLFL